MRHCRLKNLAKATMEYYQEDLEYFQRITQLKYVNEITREVMDNFVDHEMNKGNRISAINTRIRGLRVFFNYCAEYGFIHGFKYPLIREDESVKVPYTNEELQRLLRRPETDRWTDWRCWAIINTFVATGIRANTLVNIRIKDVDFDQNTIFLDAMSSAFLMMTGVSSEPGLQMIRSHIRSSTQHAKVQGKKLGRRPTNKDDIPPIFYKHYPAYISRG